MPLIHGPVRPVDVSSGRLSLSPCKATSTNNSKLFSVHKRLNIESDTTLEIPPHTGINGRNVAVHFSGHGASRLYDKRWARLSQNCFKCLGPTPNIQRKRSSCSMEASFRISTFFNRRFKGQRRRGWSIFRRLNLCQFTVKSK